MPHYIILSSNNSQSLVNEINEFVDKGYLCDGSLVIETSQDSTFLYQRMVKTSKPDEKPRGTFLAMEAYERFAHRMCRKLAFVRDNIRADYLKAAVTEVTAALTKGPTIEDLQERI